MQKRRLFSILCANFYHFAFLSQMSCHKPLQSPKKMVGIFRLVRLFLKFVRLSVRGMNPHEYWKSLSAFVRFISERRWTLKRLVRFQSYQRFIDFYTSSIYIYLCTFVNPCNHYKRTNGHKISLSLRVYKITTKNSKKKIFSLWSSLALLCFLGFNCLIRICLDQRVLFAPPSTCAEDFFARPRLKCSQLHLTPLE